jgi:hypothetical protein
VKLIDISHDAIFLDVDGIPVVKIGHESHVAFTAGEGAGGESRPYPNARKAGLEGGRLTRDEFVSWLVTGRNKFDC